MSDYTRMVSYFYRYQNGGKLENVGYGRVECRQDMLRVTLNLNDNRVISNLDCDIYFYRYQQGNMHIVKLGKAVFEKGNLNYHVELEEAEILKEEAALNTFSGMLVYHDEQLFYGSQWDDEPIYIGDFVRTMRGQKTVQSEESSMKESSNPVKSMPKANNKIEHKNTIKMNKEERRKETEKQFVNLTSSDLMGNQGQKEERNPEKTAPKTIEAQQVENGDAALTGIPYLLKHRNPLPDFANHEVMQCVRIMPEDIGLLNRANWDYGNNSFVMHGFYNYRYLLLGSMQFADGTRQYVLGVPGIFSNKDKYLAGIFGFNEFIPIRSCPYKTGEFGYWLGRLK